MWTELISPLSDRDARPGIETAAPPGSMGLDSLRAARRCRPRGYALLAVLAVMVLIATALTTLSKLSLRRALAAADAQVRLQQRLGAESIENVLLPEAAGVFAALEEQAERSRIEAGTATPIPRRVRGAITLGGVTFDVVIADEDAKLNVNQLYHATGPQRTESAIVGLVGPVAKRALRLVPATRPMERLLWEQSEDETDDNESEEDGIGGGEPLPRAFRSWGEVFDLDALSAGMGSDAALPNVTTDLTCWGGGGLNLRRASDATIQAAAACVLSDAGAGRLVSRYRENPALPLGILVQREANTETQRSRLRRMLTESSTHFSLWIDASAIARRSMRTFSVMRKTDDGTLVNERFAF